jgi:hypothetical protein
MHHDNTFLSGRGPDTDVIDYLTLYSFNNTHRPKAKDKNSMGGKHTSTCCVVTGTLGAKPQPQYNKYLTLGDHQRVRTSLLRVKIFNRHHDDLLSNLQQVTIQKWSEPQLFSCIAPSRRLLYFGGSRACGMSLQG